MPKLSAADTLPEKSSARLPVSTIAPSGVMTRMPRVCISIVASAFQYGCAPTLIPLTTRFTSPPSCVKSIRRLSTRAIQSMFSVPLSIEILAPADTGNHSSGTRICSARSIPVMIRRHSASASEPISRLGSPSSSTRVIPSGYAAVKLRMTPTMMFALFWPYGRSTGCSAFASSRSYSTKSPCGKSDCVPVRAGVSILMIS